MEKQDDKENKGKGKEKLLNPLDRARVTNRADQETRKKHKEEIISR